MGILQKYFNDLRDLLGNDLSVTELYDELRIVVQRINEFYEDCLSSNANSLHRD